MTNCTVSTVREQGGSSKKCAKRGSYNIMIKISCIIPSHNERPRIVKVLDVVIQHPLIDEVIVVDDGSTDNTREVLATFKTIRVITHEKNHGKSMAIYTGMKESAGDFIFLLDADLVGLTLENITALIQPVLSSRAEVSISLRKNTPWPWRMIGLDYLSGERVFPRKILLDHIHKEIFELPGFGLEVFLNKIIIKNRCRINIVLWKNVSSPFKHKKHGFIKGVRGEIRMMREIFKTISVFEATRQIIAMLRLRID